MRKRRESLLRQLAMGSGILGVSGGPSDIIAPTCVITCDKTSPTGESPMTFTATFSEDVTGFVIGDFGIANGTKGTFTAVSASVYTLAVTPDAFGDVTATVAAGVCTDAAGNANEEATPLVIFYGVFDPNGIADGALPAPWGGSATFAIASNVVVNTPTEGSELLTDGGLENWASATDLTSWTETIQAGGTSTINQESTTIHGGSNAARMDIDAANKWADLGQTPTLAIGDFFNIRAYLRASAASKTIGIRAENQLHSGLAFVPSASEYTLHVNTALKRISAGFTVSLRTISAASQSIYLDDLSVKKLTTTTLFATAPATVADCTVKAAWTTTRGTLSGVIMNLDSISNPQNYVLFLQDGDAGGVYLWKVVGGVPQAQVATGAITYVPNANVELRKSGTTYQMFYNGSQVGTDQTISDAGIINNTIHGIFSTYGGNSLNRFFLG